MRGPALCFIQCHHIPTQDQDTGIGFILRISNLTCGCVALAAAMRGPGPGCLPGSWLSSVQCHSRSRNWRVTAWRRRRGGRAGAVSAGLGPTVVIIGLRWPPGTLGNNDQYGTHLTFALGDFTLGSRLISSCLF